MPVLVGLVAHPRSGGQVAMHSSRTMEAKTEIVIVMVAMSWNRYDQVQLQSSAVQPVDLPQPGFDH
jgi:hypothetical protein